MSSGATPHQPRRRFSQNFLHDRAVVARIVRAIAPTPGQRLVEIGPGQGALTEPLLRALGRLDAVEIDRDLAAALEHRLGPEGLHVHLGDATRFDVRSLEAGAHGLRIVGNLPYHVSTPLLFALLARAEAIDDMHFMLQREVVDRIVAGPGTRRYGRLSVMVQLDASAEKLFDIGPGAFRPAPKVTSSLVRLVVHRHPPVSPKDRKTFADVVARLFATRRKTVRNGLRGLLEPDAIARAGVDPGARAETLPLEALCALADAVRLR